MSSSTTATTPIFKTEDLPQEPVARLIAVMTALRDPVGGCPWDLKQDFTSLAKYTLEEAYEVVEAVEKQDFNALRDELGDLLLQIVFYGQMGREAGHFDFMAIATTLTDKLIRRHPHVFGDEQIASAEAMTERWESDKAKERAEKSANLTPAVISALDGITSTLPTLTRCQKLVQRATRVGFDWDEPADVFPKLQEEIAELAAELPELDHGRMTDELGDVLFTVVCLAHKLKIDPETALRRANVKFERRFKGMELLLESKIAQNNSILLPEWESAWQEIKAQERSATD
jgi:ATP diphosphatase